MSLTKFYVGEFLQVLQRSRILIVVLVISVFFVLEATVKSTTCISVNIDRFREDTSSLGNVLMAEFEVNGFRSFVAVPLETPQVLGEMLVERKESLIIGRVDYVYSAIGLCK